jgi:hypothetical protein
MSTMHSPFQRFSIVASAWGLAGAAGAFLLALASPAVVTAQDATELRDPPGLDALVDFDRSQSDMRVAIDRYSRRCAGRAWCASIRAGWTRSRTWTSTP